MSERPGQDRLVVVLMIMQLIGMICALVVGVSAWLGQSNTTQMQVSNGLPAQIDGVKKELTGKIQDLQLANNAQFSAIAAAIQSIPNLNASLPQLSERVSRVEQGADALRARLDAVQALGVQNDAALKAALQAGITGQRGGH